MHKNMSIKFEGKVIRDEIIKNLKLKVLDLQKYLAGNNLEIIKPRLDIFVVGDNPATESFVKIKQKTADEIGVNFVIHRYNENIIEEELKIEIDKIQNISDSVIIQLPVPTHINIQNILNVVNLEKDIDVLSDVSRQIEYTDRKIFKSSMQQTLDIILNYKKTELNLNYSKVGIVGMGKLIGEAAKKYFVFHKKEIQIFEKGDSLENLKSCDVIVSGTGVSNLIGPHLASQNILIDFGYGTIDGRLVGDISAECYKDAKLYTTVPGGTGPVMVAAMFINLIESFERKLNL
jgi:methylenetetrahydrofolate dehydrogenase (NADP+)/methenyltetrahydrofolate cyclohydrolase